MSLYFYFQRKASADTRQNAERIIKEHLKSTFLIRNNDAKKLSSKQYRGFILLREIASIELQNERPSSRKSS